MIDCHPYRGGTEVGVGVVYNGALAHWLGAHPDTADVVSIIPEILWHESCDQPRYRWISSAVESFDTAVSSKPCVFHGIGLSLGSGLPLDLGHVDQVAEAVRRYRPFWYSEHLAAFRIGNKAAGSAHAGVGLPVPMDGPTLRLVVPKVAATMSRLGVPMLIENNAVYVEVPEPSMSEAGFLNRLCAETGAGVLLDLHNLLVNEINLGWNAGQYLEELDLENVVEIHVAGGEMLGRWYTDAHSGECPAAVWRLLDQVVPAAPALRLVTFEFHESRFEQLGGQGLQNQLGLIRSTLRRAPTHVS